MQAGWVVGSLNTYYIMLPFLKWSWDRRHRQLFRKRMRVSCVLKVYYSTSKVEKVYTFVLSNISHKSMISRESFSRFGARYL